MLGSKTIIFDENIVELSFSGMTSEEIWFIEDVDRWKSTLDSFHVMKNGLHVIKINMLLRKKCDDFGNHAFDNKATCFHLSFSTFAQLLRDRKSDENKSYGALTATLNSKNSANRFNSSKQIPKMLVHFQGYHLVSHQMIFRCLSMLKPIINLLFTFHKN